MNDMKAESKIAVYFDGQCRLCSREISYYQRQRGAENIKFVDICAEGFDAKTEGLDPREVHKVMHVRRVDGTFAKGVDAFIEIWKCLPKFRTIARVAEKYLIKKGLEVGYSCFAMIRPFLPRRSKAESCQESPYCDL